MADGRGERVGGVVGPGLVVEAQDAADHVHDLALIRRARADHCLLDLHGGVLAHREAGLRTGDDGHPSRLRGGDGALHVLAEIDVLDGELGRPVALDDRPDLVVDAPEAGVDGLVGLRGHAAVGAGTAGGPLVSMTPQPVCARPGSMPRMTTAAPPVKTEQTCA